MSSSFNQPMAVERGRSHELVGSMVGAIYVHVLRTLARFLLQRKPSVNLAQCSNITHESDEINI